jgi:hypothetical protein
MLGLMLMLSPHTGGVEVERVAASPAIYTMRNFASKEEYASIATLKAPRFPLLPQRCMLPPPEITHSRAGRRSSVHTQPAVTFPLVRPATPAASTPTKFVPLLPSGSERTKCRLSPHSRRSTRYVDRYIAPRHRIQLNTRANHTVGRPRPTQQFHLNVWRLIPQRIYDNIAAVVRETNALPENRLHVFPVNPNYAEVFQMAK